MNPLKVGNVVRVENGKVQVVITAKDLNVLHEERTYRVGQLGSYLTIPMDAKTIIGFVTGTGRQDVTVVDVEPQLMMDVQLVGEVMNGKFVRGVTEYPIVGDDVWVAVHKDFEAIFGSFDQLLAGSKHPQSFTLGKFALNQEFDVKILGSELFSKHVSILGNSGSGKSCTTAKILQEIVDFNQAQVIMFDMHGEYRSAFCDEQGQIAANVTYLGSDDLVLPYWLLKYEELEALFLDRSNPLNISMQISFLRAALLEFKKDAAEEMGLAKALTLDTPIYFSMEKLKVYAENLNDARFVLNDDHLAFSQLALRSLPPEEQQKLMREKRCQFNRGNPEGETPHPLYFGKLVGLIDQIDTKFNDRRYEFLLRPVEHGLKSRYFRGHLDDAAGRFTQTSNLMNHLIRLLTGRLEPRSNLTIIDLSGIPFEIVDVTVAVLTRLIFDLNFWTPAAKRHPSLLVFEEAHNYIPRTDVGKHFAKTAVERVAKEGRKYGVSAMVVSQRPSELSETVLSQCNSYVVLRMSNPEDQKYVAKVVGDHFAGVIQMLPSMRPGEAFVIGDSVLMPMRTLVDLPKPCPLSGNLDFFKFWSADTVEDNLDQVIEHWRRQDRQLINRVPGQDVNEGKPEGSDAPEPYHAGQRLPGGGPNPTSPRGPVPAAHRPAPPRAPVTVGSTPKPRSKWLAKNAMDH